MIITINWVFSLSFIWLINMFINSTYTPKYFLKIEIQLIWHVANIYCTMRDN